MRARPRRNRQELAPVRRDGEWKPLPQRFGDEWHDRMQQPQRVVEDVSQYRTRHFAVVSGCSDSSLRGLEVPIGDVVPDEPPRSLGVFAQAQSGVALLRTPFVLFRSRGTERKIAFQDRGVEPPQYPPVRKGQLGVTQLV